MGAAAETRNLGALRSALPMVVVIITAYVCFVGCNINYELHVSQSRLISSKRGSRTITWRLTYILDGESNRPSVDDRGSQTTPCCLVNGCAWGRVARIFESVDRR